MSTPATIPAVMGDYRWDYPSADLADLRDANSLLADPAALRRRLHDDGYLLLRGLQRPDRVEAAHQVVLRHLAERGFVDLAAPRAPHQSAAILPGGGGAFLGGHKPVTHSPDYLALVESPEILDFFSHLLDGPIRTYDFKWLRAVNSGFTGCHYDVVYMGRGTLNVYTCWTPLHHTPIDHGPLALCLGSPDFQNLRQTYGAMDVDRDKVRGWFTNDPGEIRSKFGGQWATTEFQAGDVLIFGMFMLHASLTNTSGRYRISSDTRYQLAADPIDERWIGDDPKAHYAWHKGEGVSMEQARARWGV